VLSGTHVYDWSKPFKEGWTKVYNVWSLYILQGKLRPVFFGTHKVSWWLIYWQSNKPLMQLIIWRFLKTE
jgi:hypothetical protein